MADNASHALASSAAIITTFNVEEEVVVIHNGWTPGKEEGVSVTTSVLVLVSQQVCWCYCNNKCVGVCATTCVLLSVLQNVCWC